MKKKKNELNDLFRREEKIKDELQQLTAGKMKELDDVHSSIVAAGLLEFSEKSKRIELIRKLEETPYSKTNIIFLRSFLDEWNQDNVNYNTIDKFHQAEKWLNSNKTNDSIIDLLGSFVVSEEADD